MSYDLYLYRKDGSKKPLTRIEVNDKLKTKYPDLEFEVEIDQALQFDVEKREIEFCYQSEDKGYYWTHCSYAVDEKAFKHFRTVVKDVGQILSLQISDPQTEETLVDPENFDIDNPKSIKIFNLSKGVLGNAPILIPTEDKYFIVYFISSFDPKTGKLVYLLLKNGTWYASKVEKGESLKQVMDREIPELTGSGEYKLIEIKQKYDTAFDRYGKELPRSALILMVPYFDTETTKTKFPMKWKESTS